MEPVGSRPRARIKPPLPMGDAQRVVLVAVGFGLTIDLLGAVEAVMVAGTPVLPDWARRVPEAMAVMVAGAIAAVLVTSAFGFRAGVYVLLVVSSVALHRVRLPEARTSMNGRRAVTLLALGAVCLAFFLVLASAVAGPA